MSEQDVKIKELEDKLNESQIREKEKDDKIKNMEQEIEWMTEQYGNLLNGTFSELFDTCTKVKSLSLDRLLQRRNIERMQSQNINNVNN